MNGSRGSTRLLKKNRGAMVEALVRVDNVLLDTGADVNVVSRGVMDALAAKGA
ncbi:unnamed protein product, partial [Aphanomyces euteiches]